MTDHEKTILISKATGYVRFTPLDDDGDAMVLLRWLVGQGLAVEINVDNSKIDEPEFISKLFEGDLTDPATLRKALVDLAAEYIEWKGLVK